MRSLATNLLRKSFFGSIPITARRRIFWQKYQRERDDERQRKRDNERQRKREKERQIKREKEKRERERKGGRAGEGDRHSKKCRGIIILVGRYKKGCETGNKYIELMKINKRGETVVEDNPCFTSHLSQNYTS